MRVKLAIQWWAEDPSDGPLAGVKEQLAVLVHELGRTKDEFERRNAFGARAQLFNVHCLIAYYYTVVTCLKESLLKFSAFKILQDDGDADRIKRLLYEIKKHLDKGMPAVRNAYAESIERDPVLDPVLRFTIRLWDDIDARNQFTHGFFFDVWADDGVGWTSAEQWLTHKQIVALQAIKQHVPYDHLRSYSAEYARCEDAFLQGIREISYQYVAKIDELTTAFDSIHDQIIHSSD